MITILVFALAALWFLSRRVWLARILVLATWFVLGAFLIQVRGRPADDPELLALSDGRVVTLTAHVIREAYAHAAGPRSIRQSLDVETEQIESEGKAWPVRAGIRLSVYERVEFPPSSSGAVVFQEADEGSGQQKSEANKSNGRSSNASEPSSTSPAPALAFPYGTRLRIRAKLHAAHNFRNPGAFDYEGYLRDNGISVLGSAQIADVEPLTGYSGSRVALWRARVHARYDGHCFEPRPQR